MSYRRKARVSRIVEKKLWAECIGHCMNPVCQVELTKGFTNIGEMAHIRPHSEGGSISFENLILLCCNCHTEIDSSRTEKTECELKNWKIKRNQESRKLFTTHCESFEQLTQAVLPLLRRNGQIFDSYGPAEDASLDADRHELWLRFENELIANNERIGLLLDRHRELLHKENQEIVDDFLIHKQEFVRTRGSDLASRERLFPIRLLSVFGLESVRESLPPNVSALQNFISKLVDKGRLVGLELYPLQVLVFRDRNRELRLDLNNRPRVQQILWNERCYAPHTTNLRLKNLVFFLEWLTNNDIRYEFPDIRDLTRLDLNMEFKIKLCYEYCLTLSLLQGIAVECGLIVVNLHTWNGAPVTTPAEEYASQVGIKALPQNDFFILAHNKIK